MGSNLWDIIENITREKISKAVSKAMKDSVKPIKARGDKFGEDVVQEYYSEYSPTKYRRSYSLLKLYDTKVRANNSELFFNIDSNNNNIPQHKSGSKYHKSGEEWISRWDDAFDYDSDSNGMPETDWIVRNYEEGVHPRITKTQNDSFYGKGEDYYFDKYIDKTEADMANIIGNNIIKNLQKG